MPKKDTPSTAQVLPSELPDYLLVQQASTNDQEAFEALVQRYQNMLQHYASAQLGYERAQDIVQFVLLQLYLAMPKLKEAYSSQQNHHSLKPWLFRVTRNRCIDELRKNKRQASLFSELEGDDDENTSLLASILDPTPLPEKQVEEKERCDQIYHALQVLSPTMRAIVLLRNEGLTFATIAQRLKMHPITAKTYFHRARVKLRAMPFLKKA
jgi:RNA polymerase sigma factor (sigma-70 family)